MANLTESEIRDCDMIAALLKIAPMTAAEIYFCNGRNTGKILGWMVQSGRVIKDGQNFRLAVSQVRPHESYVVETMQDTYDWRNQ